MKYKIVLIGLESYFIVWFVGVNLNFIKEFYFKDVYSIVFLEGKMLI